MKDGSLRLFQSGPAIGLKLFILVVLSLCLMLVDTHSNYLSVVRQALSTFIYPFRELVYFPGKAFDQAEAWVTAASTLTQEQAELENTRIRLAQTQTQFDQVAAENEQLRQLLEIKSKVTTPAVAVEILYMPANPLGQTLVLTKGSEHGIQLGVPVIGDGGVVGQIQRVNPLTSEVALITDEKVSIPAMDTRNGLRVIVFGSGQPSLLEIRYLSNDADIQVGDKIITSGIGGVYPPGLSVGTVRQIEKHTADGFMRAWVEPSAHPERYRHFLVLLTKQDKA